MALLFALRLVLSLELWAEFHLENDAALRDLTSIGKAIWQSALVYTILGSAVRAC